MRICKLTVENVKSFLNKAELILDSNISIIIGPNGGGKSNLLDILVIVIRKFLYGSQYPQESNTSQQVEYLYNEKLNGMILEPHSSGKNQPQFIEIEIECTADDKQKMEEMQSNAKRLEEISGDKYKKAGLSILTENWDLKLIQPGKKFKYKLRFSDNAFIPTSENEEGAKFFHTYLSLYERYEKIRDEYYDEPLVTPFLFLSANRGLNFKTDIELHQYDEYELNKQIGSTTSRSNSPIINFAIGQIIQKYRLLLDTQVKPMEYLNEKKSIKELNSFLKKIGYSWEIECINPNKNHYDLKLKKNGIEFPIGSASSGEIELLTYLFTIYFLNVSDAIIIIDEAELHLHPQWQKSLFDLFIKLSKETGNQFIISTHSPSFITPHSIEYVSRVYNNKVQSQIVRLNKDDLPQAKQLLKMINSQNNEVIFFADEVTLVEGPSDRIFFKALFNHFNIANEYSGLTSNSKIIEFIDVGGKLSFEHYSKLLQLLCIKSNIIADLDYALNIGSSDIKKLLTPDYKKLRESLCQIGNKDGVKLIKMLDDAIDTKNFEDLQNFRDYLKTRHQKIRKDLNSDEEKVINDFINEQKESNCFILRKGSLEDYLPTGFKCKDTNKIISLINEEHFTSSLPEEGLKELEEILKTIIGI
ncbi:AAA family ATPase [Legionella bozemanae]|uniref:Chromosome partition protein Smc n=1 Tax=Legionella bozemanae TaxID=447 RepID=A0A0W0S1L3_LEGBO|nr:AAA family ATPase [Legionella bozemanae]KTC77272.1 Chromosome partition protein Smc [Legionella bozemanae]STO34924.1 Predicted ATP-binding protein involved in virulence [Legionella bozemanae]